MRLQAEAVTLAYDRHVVARDLTVEIPDHSFTAIIGPNACGKSTLLRALARLLPPRAGRVTLDGRPLASYGGKALARQLALLPQEAIAPDGITVRELVARGRYPHQGLWRADREADNAAIDDALAATGIADLSDRPVAELSGGQRQRAWVAMALAQRTQILLLDEPTTYLDITHQIGLMDLFASLHREGSTLVAVLHDLNQAARYATHLIAMRDGKVCAQGPPAEVLTTQLVADVFAIDSVIIPDPITGTPLVVPAGHPGGGAATVPAVP